MAIQGEVKIKIIIDDNGNENIELEVDKEINRKEWLETAAEQFSLFVKNTTWITVSKD